MTGTNPWEKPPDGDRAPGPHGPIPPPGPAGPLPPAGPMSPPGPLPPPPVTATGTRRRAAGRTGYVIGAAFIVVAVALCCGGGTFLVGPAVRAGERTERAVIGMAVFDMHEGDEYWIYEPAGAALPDPIECEYDERQSYVIPRSQERPFGAPATITESGEDYEFYGVLAGDRNENVLIQCPSDRYLVKPSLAPRWTLLAVGGAGVFAGLLGLVLALVTAARRRPDRAARRAAAAGARPAAVIGAGQPIPPAGSYPGSPPGAGQFPAPPLGPGAPAGRTATRGRVSALWYLVVLPLLALSVISCLIGLAGGLGGGFLDSFDPPTIGQERGGTVGDAWRYNDQYLLYADVAEDPPTEPVACVLSADTGTVTPLRVDTDRPFGAPETVTEEGRTFRFFAAFRLDDPVLGTITCEGDATLLSRPSNRPQLWVAGGVGTAVGALLIAGIAWAGLSAMRRRSAPVQAAAAGSP